MHISIIGLPLSGKTTLFKTLCGTEPVQGLITTVKVPGERIDKLSEIFKPKKTTYATIEFLDTRLSFDTHGGLSSKSIDTIRIADALCIVIRLFENDSVPHPSGEVNPLKDFENMEYELLLTDSLQIEKRLERLAKENKKSGYEFQVLEKLKESLDRDIPLYRIDLNNDELKTVSGYRFLTLKPFIVVLNNDESEKNDDSKLVEYLKNKGYSYIKIFGKIEEEIAQHVTEEEKKIFMDDIGVKESVIGRLIKKSYEALDLISFITVGEDEVRAWPVRRGRSAVEAAGKIHSDISRGFIRAEVVHYDDFIRKSSMKACKEKGLLRLEGKDYIVKDGDIISFRFNV